MESQTLTVQAIPINKILPNPNQPRQHISPESKAQIKASLEKSGQQTPVKVRPLTPQEKAAYPAYEYLLLGGHRRREGALALGWETLSAIVLDTPPDEDDFVGLTDNSWNDMNWYEWAIAIERLKKAHPKMTQEEISDRLGRSRVQVAYSLKIAGALNAAARDLVCNEVTKTGQGWKLTERPMLALADLVPLNEDLKKLENPQKALEEAQTLVLGTLKVVIERQMTEAEAKEVVESIKQGKSPESYGEKAGETALNGTEVASSSSPAYSAGTPRKDSGLDSADPFEAYWAGLPKAMKVSQTKKGYRLVVNLAPKEAVPVVYGVKARLEELKASKEGVFKTEVASSPTPAYPAGAPRNDSNLMAQAKPGPLGILKKALGEKLKINPAGIEENLAKDAKQAVNYQIRRGMRNILKDIF